jgi:hypothetical protein
MSENSMSFEKNKMEMAGYSVMKFYLEKNNLHYFTFSPNPEKSVKAAIPHLSPDTIAKKYF